MDLKYAGRMKSLNPNAAVPGCIERVKELTANICSETKARDLRGEWARAPLLTHSTTCLRDEFVRKY